MSGDKNRILYVGGFQLPDRNAAAHRVLGIGKSLRDSGFIVEYLDVSDLHADGVLSPAWDCQGFTAHTQRHSSNTRQRIEYTLKPLHVEELLNKHDDWRAVIAYNYPAAALIRLRSICHRRSIALISDCTEWYAFEPKNLTGLFTFIDSELRMRFVQKRIDGMIAISEYLGRYYEKYLPTIVVPPTVDLSEDKWRQSSKKEDSDITVLTYAGSYSKNKSKDRIDYMVKAIESSGSNIRLNIIGFTREQYIDVFGANEDNTDRLIHSGRLRFYGRLSHRDALKIIQESDYCMFFRLQHKLTRAGFPTKFVESISCGTPVITTKTSDLENYIQSNGFFVSEDRLDSLCSELINKKELKVDSGMFDYRRYTPVINALVLQSGEVFIE